MRQTIMNLGCTLLVNDLGKLDYLSALELQERLVQWKQERERPDILLLLEHPHVFTLGRSGKSEHLRQPGGIPLYRTGRGGDITYHGPGQMIAYPLVDLRSKLRRDVHLFLRRLEEAGIGTLRSFGISAARKPPWTGVWIERRKIAAIGLAVRRGITCHGLALNVSPDLRYFHRIVPCGLSWAEVTSIERERSSAPSIETVKQEFLRRFMEIFSYVRLEELCLEDIPIGSKSGPRAVPIIWG